MCEGEENAIQSPLVFLLEYRLSLGLSLIFSVPQDTLLESTFKQNTVSYVLLKTRLFGD
jgi:hypothetical protein